jgi:hypothetical protein
LRSGSYPFEDMDSLFRYVGDHLKQDSLPGSRRTFTSAGFSREDGHITQYIRSVWSTRERIEVTVSLHRISAQPAARSGRPRPESSSWRRGSRRYPTLPPRGLHARQWHCPLRAGRDRRMARPG